MELLFSEAGLRCLDDIARPGVLCAFDFDGTLAPIVPVPNDAHMPQTIRESLSRLSVYAPVAIITGRAVDDIRQRLDFVPDFLVGNHGLEGVPGCEAQAERHEQWCRNWREQLEPALREFGPGVNLEDKRYSLSVHYRHAANPEAAADRLRGMLARLTPRPRVVSGKCVFNLLAQDAGDKGTALGRLISHCGARSAIYAGDDVTDEDVFRLVRGDVLSVRVEQERGSAADWYVPHFSDMALLLENLIERLCAAGARNWVRQGDGLPAPA